MKVKIHTPILCFLFFAICTRDGFCQGESKFVIKDSNYSLTILSKGKQKHYTSVEIQNKELAPSDVIIASDKALFLKVKLPSAKTGAIQLYFKMEVSVSHIEKSRYFELDDETSIFQAVSAIWNWFSKTDERPEDLHKRYLREIGGSKLGVNNDILSSTAIGQNSLGSKDEKLLNNLNDSLSKADIRDSLLFYLNRAVFFDEKMYLNRAYANYELAYKASKGDKSKKEATKLIFQQFLYRMGRFEEAKHLN